jgi:hypothetical protein
MTKIFISSIILFFESIILLDPLFVRQTKW